MQIVDISANNVIKKWTFQVTVNGTPFNYLSNGSDDSTTIATQLANVMTASGVTATASGTQLRLTADVPGVEFTYSATATDLTAPAITNVVNASETLKSGAVTTTSLSIDEPGNIYFVLSGSVANTTGDINTLLLAGHAFLGQAGATTDTPYTFTVPAGISDGSYGAVAVDTFNNVSGYHVTGLVVDNTPPVVTIVTASGQTVSTATFVVSGTTEPLLGVTISTASGSTSISAIGNGDFSGSVALNLNAPNTVTVTATDVAGNVGSSTIQVTQDSINPLFTFSPSATITNQTSITFNGSTEANVDVGIIGGLAPVHVISGNDGSFSGTLNLNRNTMNTLDVTTTDLANNTSTGSFTVTQDDILPTVAIATASGSVVDSATFQIDGSTEMNTSVTVYNQSGSVVGTNVASGTGAFSVSATLLQDATNVLTVTATDAAGNQSSDAVSVIEDSMSNTIVIMPVLPTATNAASINVAGNTKANSSLSLVHSGGLTQTGTTADGTFTFPVTLLANTTNDITLTSQDLAGHVATGSVSIVHDSIAPVVTLGGVDLTTSLTSYTMTGTTEPLASLVITGGSGANVGGTADGSGSFSIAVPLQIGAVNALVLTATDLAGNSGTGGVNITQDPVPLTLVLNPIGTVITNATTFTISGTSKANADIAITGSGSANTVASSTGTFSVTVNLVNDGLNTFLVTASDAAGAQLTDTFSVTQDSIAPVLGLANSTGATAQLSYVLNGTTESGATVHANVVGTGAFTGTISSIGTASGTFSMTIPLLANTGGTFDIIAMDTAGNMSTGATLSVLQDNLAPAIGTQSFSGSTTGGVSIGYYQFTTNEVTDSTFYVGTGSNVLTSLIWTGATNGLNHSGTIVGIQAGVSYYTFVRAIDALGNTTDSAVAPVLFAAAGTTGGSMGGSTGGSSGGSSGGSTGGSTGGSSGGYGPLIISYPSGGNVTSSTSTGTTVTTQSGATQTGTTTGVKKPVTTVKKPGTIIKKPTTIVTKPTTPTKKPTSVTKPTVKPTPVKP